MACRPRAVILGASKATNPEPTDRHGQGHPVVVSGLAPSVRPGMTISDALAAFRQNTAAAAWLALPFFADGTAERVAQEVDTCIAGGREVLPAPENVFNALALTPLETVKVVILGQDPYPTPGDAHGLAFSYVGQRRLPASLKAILAEMADDLGGSLPPTGDLTHWARQGALLLNTALTTEAGCAGAHLRLGWSALADQAVAAVSATRPAVVFMLWGAPARQRAALIDRTKHLVIESGHPSPLNARRDFSGTRPFSRANAWLAAHGLEPVKWRLEGAASTDQAQSEPRQA